MEQTTNKRRSFLKHIITGTAVIAGTTFTGKHAKARGNKRTLRPDEVLYKKTDAFKKYYESLR